MRNRKLSFTFRSPHLNRLIAVRGLDRQRLIELLDTYYFPTEMIDELTDFLETEVIRILIQHEKQKMPSKNVINCPSTDVLKRIISTGADQTAEIYLADEFFAEYFDRLAAGMNSAQLKFYDRAFGGLRNDSI